MTTESGREHLREALRRLDLEDLYEEVLDDIAGRVAGGLRSTVAESREPYSAYPAQVRILAQKLGAYGVEVESFQEGRPTTAVVRAPNATVFIGEDHDDWGKRVTSDEPVTVVVAYAKNRTRGQTASFNLSGFSAPPKSEFERAAEPALYFMVLGEEERVWVLARGALRDIHKKIRHGGKVSRFTSPRKGALRVLLPKKELGFSLDQCVYVEESGGAS